MVPSSPSSTGPVLVPQPLLLLGGDPVPWYVRWYWMYGYGLDIPYCGYGIALLRVSVGSIMNRARLLCTVRNTVLCTTVLYRAARRTVHSQPRRSSIPFGRFDSSSTSPLSVRTRGFPADLIGTAQESRSLAYLLWALLLLGSFCGRVGSQCRTRGTYSFVRCKKGESLRRYLLERYISKYGYQRKKYYCTKVQKVQYSTFVQ